MAARSASRCHGTLRLARRLVVAPDRRAGRASSSGCEPASRPGGPRLQATGLRPQGWARDQGCPDPQCAILVTTTDNRQVNREVGAKPTRSRHCKRSQIVHVSLRRVRRGKTDEAQSASQETSHPVSVPSPLHDSGHRRDGRREETHWLARAPARRHLCMLPPSWSSSPHHSQRRQRSLSAVPLPTYRAPRLPERR